MGILRKGGTLTITWEGFVFGSYARDADIRNSVVIQKKPNEDCIELGYIIVEQDDVHKRIHCRVRLTRTTKQWGGFRYYFICPLTVNGAPCLRRVAVLYLPLGEELFGCRNCHEIKYPTQVFNKRHSGYDNVKRSLIEGKIDKLEIGLREYYGGIKTKRNARLDALYKEKDKYPI